MAGGSKGKKRASGFVDPDIFGASSSDLESVTAQGKPSSEPGGYDHHPVHYHDDGNIIFITGNTMFRHYKGLLARHSSNIRDRFVDPRQNPPRASDPLGKATSPNCEVYDGVQVIRLSVSTDEFASLLDYIFPVVLTRDSVTQPSIETLLSILRVSFEYTFTSAQAAAVSTLKEIVPTTFTSYCAADKRFPALQGSRPADVILMARKSDLPEFLPLAFYLLAVKWPESGDLTDLARICEILDPMDVARVVRGRRELSKRALAMANRMHQYYSTEHPECRTRVRNKEECKKGKSDSLFNDVGEALDEFVQDPLRVLMEPQMLFLLCEPCRTAHTAQDKARAQNLFNDLGTIFQLSVRTN